MLGPSKPLVPPIYQTSVFAIPDLDALEEIMTGAAPGFIYARDAHPNAHKLAADLAALEGAAWGLMASSGMAAESASLLALVKPGDSILASNRLYGRTNTLIRQELKRFGVQSTIVDASDLDAVRQAMAEKPRVLFVETMSNPLCRVPDLPALAELAKANGCRFVVDNTFATPAVTKPIAIGADLVVESLTKMIGGHSDVTLGVVCGNDPELLPAMTQIVSVWGLASPPFDCWLAQRSLATLRLRMHTAMCNAAAVADWLVEQPGVSRVVYPGRADHPDRAVAAKVCAGGFGNMLCFELAGGRDAVNRFMRLATGVPFSPSLGHTGTTCSHPATTSHRYESPAERQRQTITDGLIRLSVGFEPVEQIRAELRRGLV
jgi:cystathionine beta-lyase/cystathionine gamma-synthase